jgi:MoxR-like ATPase
MAKTTFEDVIEQFVRSYQLMLREIGKVIVGQRSVLDQMLAAILSRGHCLLVGVPGLAKTLMVSSMAQIMDLSFKRIQFTPDLMPSDITGTNVIDEPEAGRRSFRFVRGPIFANMILADEINRTPPKTQAAMLQAMQEREVTVGQETYPLPDPFFVIATQNPIEMEGTYPLPEAQLDRFMFNIFVDYPSLKEEERILQETTGLRRSAMDIVLNARQVINLQRVVATIPASEYVIRYATSLVRATRPADPTSPAFVKQMVDWGAGPRAGQYLIMGGKAFAAMAGRLTVSAEDVRNVAVPVLRHRIATNFAAGAEGVDSVAVIRRLIELIGEPELSKYAARRPAAQAPTTVPASAASHDAHAPHAAPAATAEVTEPAEVTEIQPTEPSPPAPAAKPPPPAPPRRPATRTQQVEPIELIPLDEDEPEGSSKK